MTEPRYSGVQKEAIPLVPFDGGAGDLALVSGEFGGAEGPIHPLTGVFMSVVNLAPGGRAELPAPRGRSVFLYVARGGITVAGAAVERWHLASVNDDGDGVDVTAGNDGAVMLFGHADPIREPVVAHGPFVMNSEAEIRQAIADYQAGKFQGTGKLVEVG
jgi:redox-sensitive bicupin YhaK (pirin superfamily)